MQKHQRLVLRTMQGLVDQAQLKHWVDDRGKYLALVIEAPDGGEHKITISSSPKTDDKALLNMARQEVTRLLRKLGLEADGKTVPKAG